MKVNKELFILMKHGNVHTYSLRGVSIFHWSYTEQWGMHVPMLNVPCFWQHSHCTHKWQCESPRVTMSVFCSASNYFEKKLHIVTCILNWLHWQVTYSIICCNLEKLRLYTVLLYCIKGKGMHDIKILPVLNNADSESHFTIKCLSGSIHSLPFSQHLFLEWFDLTQIVG